MKYQIKAFSIYEKGHYRDNQEDSIFPPHQKATDDDRLFMVCDGMGGHEAGEVASQAVCEAMSRVITEAAPAEEPLTEDILAQALTAAYDLLDQRDPDPESTKKMGTTMTLLKLHSDGATVAHIGDSRIYQFRPDGDGKMQVAHKTCDHSLVNDLLKVGELTPEEAENFPRKNVITRAMQAHLERRPRADVTLIGDVRAGDYFLLCSDGMLEQTSDENLCFMIGKPKTTDEEKVKMLRETSDDNRDNHSAYLIHVLKTSDATTAVTRDTSRRAPVGTSTPPEEKSSSLLRKLSALVTALAVIVGGWIYSSQHTKTTEPAVPEAEDSSMPRQPLARPAQTRPAQAAPQKPKPTPQGTEPARKDSTTSAPAPVNADDAASAAEPEPTTADNSQATASTAVAESPQQAEAESDENQFINSLKQKIKENRNSRHDANTPAQ